MGIEGLIGLGFGLFWGVFITHFYYVRNRIRENPPEGKHYFIRNLRIKVVVAEGPDEDGTIVLKDVKIPFIPGKTTNDTVTEWVIAQGIVPLSIFVDGGTLRGV